MKSLRVVFLFLFVMVWCFGEAWGREDVEGKVRVIDGDSLWVGGEEVRLQGVDMVEYKQWCGGKKKERWHCGKGAYEEMISLTKAKRVHCKIEEKDKYGRWVGICGVEGGVEDLAKEMVLRGYGVSLPWYTERYVRDEARARGRGVGIWGDVFARPSAWRKRNPR